MGVLSKVHNRREAYDAVLDEQDEQDEIGLFDPEAMAQIYRDVTASHQIWAQTVALQDAKAAELIYEEDGLYD